MRRYDADGRLRSLARDGSATVDLDYDPDGRIVTARLPGQVDRLWSYTAGRLTSYAETAAGASTNTVLGYDPVGRVVAEAVDGASTTYGYDPAGQLISVNAPGSTADVTVGYDAAGHRTSYQRGASTTTFSYDAAHQLVSSSSGPATTTHGYDQAGRRITSTQGPRTQTQTYDARGRLTAVSGSLQTVLASTSTRSYDASDRLRQIATSGPTQSSTLALTWDTNRGIDQLLGLDRDGVHSDLVGTPGDWVYAGRGATLIALPHDVRGNLTATSANTDLVTPGSGYEPWGRPQGTSTGIGPLPPLQPSEPLPALGYRGELHTHSQIHLRARTLDPVTASFTSTDPLDGTPGTPTVANPYPYADNDPINHQDPSGLSTSVTDDELNQAGLLAGPAVLVGENLCLRLATLGGPRATSAGSGHGCFAAAAAGVGGGIVVYAGATYVLDELGNVLRCIPSSRCESDRGEETDPKPSPRPPPVPDPMPTADCSLDVLLDTSAVKAQAAARRLMKPGECAVISVTVQREAAEQGFYAEGLPVIADGTSAVLRAQVAAQLRGFNAELQGFTNDVVIGATALEHGMPLITGDRDLVSAVLKLRGDGRLIAPGA